MRTDSGVEVWTETVLAVDGWALSRRGLLVNMRTGDAVQLGTDSAEVIASTIALARTALAWAHAHKKGHTFVRNAAAELLGTVAVQLRERVERVMKA